MSEIDTGVILQEFYFTLFEGIMGEWDTWDTGFKSTEPLPINIHYMQYCKNNKIF